MRKRYEMTKQKYLLDCEQKELERLLERWKDRDPRNCNLLWMALHTGARASEILNITREDFDPKEATVFIHGLKGSDNREIPIPRWLAKRLEKMVPAEDGRLFPISYDRFKQIWWMYRPVKKKLHSLRHTFAINVYRKRHNVKAVQMALGHRDWANTMIYANYQYKMNEFRREILG